MVAVSPVFLTVARLFITHGKDIYLQSLNNSSKSRLALCFENLIFTTFRTTTFIHRCHVTGNALIQRTHSFCHYLARREVYVTIKKPGFLVSPYPNQASFSAFFQYNTYNKTFPEPDLTSRILTEVMFCNFAAKMWFVHCMN